MTTKTVLTRTASHIRKINIVMAIICLLGIGVSVELTRIHVFTHTDPSFHSLCAVNEEVNCETVALSPYSIFAGLPISVWGIMGYLAMGILCTWSVLGPRSTQPWVHVALISLSSFSLLIAIVLMSISFNLIDSVCLFCMASYGINLTLFILSIAVVRRVYHKSFTWFPLGIRSFFSNPPLAACFLLIVGSSAAMVEAAVKPYWESPGWRDLPSLPQGIDDHGHHWIGARNPSVTIVEFSDYECPHCRKAHKKIRMLAAKYEKEVRLYHRHLPLDRACHPRLKREFHRHACLFAEAAECAGEQGEFWRMNDALFSIQDEIKSQDVDVKRLAIKIGLNFSEFQKCMKSENAKNKIDEDLEASIKKGLKGTPTFFVEDKKYVGKVPESELKKFLEG